MIIVIFIVYIHNHNKNIHSAITQTYDVADWEKYIPMVTRYVTQLGKLIESNNYLNAASNLK